MTDASRSQPDPHRRHGCFFGAPSDGADVEDCRPTLPPPLPELVRPPADALLGSAFWGGGGADAGSAAASFFPPDEAETDPSHTAHGTAQRAATAPTAWREVSSLSLPQRRRRVASVDGLQRTPAGPCKARAPMGFCEGAEPSGGW